MKKNKNLYFTKINALLIALIFLIFSFFLYVRFVAGGDIINNPLSPVNQDLRKITSVDTTKYSRDVAREKLGDPSFDQEIDRQVSEIAATGATHIAIGTPYDEEFLPFLKRWVVAARKYGLNVWFRGNWSGWEGWFEYPKITRQEHLEKTVNFILNNSDLFENGDIFVACNECENGGPGDPRKTGDIAGYRQFMVTEYQQEKQAFEKIGKSVRANFNSMNGDVARLIMDKKTTQEMDGIVTVDHYVESPETLAQDLKDLAKSSGGEVVLGEFGVPILDINGDMTQKEQADWINNALARIFKTPEVVGLNYWVSVGGSTALWTPEGNAKEGVDVLTSYYKKNLNKLPRDY